MARIRSVHPDICASETMADLSAEVERTFVRLLTHCDDHGRCFDSARVIKGAIYPIHDAMTAKKVDAHLTKLAEAGLIRRYEVDGKACIVVTSWAEYQHPQKPKPSKVPDPPVDPTGEDSTDTGLIPDEVQPPDATDPVGVPLGGEGSRSIGGERDTAVDKPRQPRSGARWTAEADCLAKRFWSDSDPKPVVGFVALRERISEALDAGHPPERVEAVLPSLPAFTRNCFDMALRDVQPRGRPPADPLAGLRALESGR